MSVPIHRREASQFEVFFHLIQLRKDITDLLLRDFGYSLSKAEKALLKQLGGESYEELTDIQKERYDKTKHRNEAFHAWYIYDMRKSIVDALRDIQTCVYVANSIFPYYMEELIERRIWQDKAIGHCNRLLQELDYAIQTLPVDINVYTRFAKSIKHEISLIKGWRKSDNKFVNKIKSGNP